MPFYEYRCGSCGKTFEHFARNTSDVAECCALCGSTDIRKLFSAFGFKSGSASSGDFRSSASSGCSSCTATSCASCKP